MRLSILSLTTLLPGVLAGIRMTSDTKATNPLKALDECGCFPIYQRLLTCQTLPVTGATDDCLCIPNPKGWYTSMSGCSTCLSLTGGSIPNDVFFGNMAGFVNQLFTSCTEFGGNVYSNGASVCATNSWRQLCVGLKEEGKGESWASNKNSNEGVNTNGTQALDIRVYSEGLATTTAKSVASTSASASITWFQLEEETATPSAASKATSKPTASANVTASGKDAEETTPAGGSAGVALAPGYLLGLLLGVAAVLL